MGAAVSEDKWLWKSSYNVKNGKILNQGLYQRSTNFALRHGQKKKINAGALQWHLKNFGLAFAHIKVNAQNLVVWVFYMIPNWFIFVKTLFLHSQYSRTLNRTITIMLFMLIFKGVRNVDHWFSTDLHFTVRFT